jgi:hypothetical protein
LLILKFGVKLLVEDRIDPIGFIKTSLLFPIDIGFLGIAFGIVILVYIQSKINSPFTPEDIILFLLLYIIGGLVVTILSKVSVTCYISGGSRTRYFAVPSYGLSTFILLLSIFILVSRT